MRRGEVTTTETRATATECRFEKIFLFLVFLLAEAAVLFFVFALFSTRALKCSLLSLSSFVKSSFEISVVGVLFLHSTLSFEENQKKGKCAKKQKS